LLLCSNGAFPLGTGWETASLGLAAFSLALNACLTGQIRLTLDRSPAWIYLATMRVSTNCSYPFLEAEEVDLALRLKAEMVVEVATTHAPHQRSSHSSSLWQEDMENNHCNLSENLSAMAAVSKHLEFASALVLELMRGALPSLWSPQQPSPWFCRKSV